MKKLFAMFVIASAILIGCSSSQGISNIQPASGAIEIPAKGEYRMWKDVSHGSFTVRLNNSSANQSVELYIVKSNGQEKWVSPSLLANSSQDLTIPADGHLFIKNFNADLFTVTYKIAE